MTIWNLGSINADHVYALPHLPAPGETLAARSLTTGLGGKGANMSVACARAGGRVEHIGAVGPEGAWMAERLNGYGVSACAVCDGFFFRGKEVAIVGAGDTAAEEALYLSKLCSTVHMFIRRGEMRASKIMRDRVLKTENIKMYWNTETDEILGEKTVDGVRVRNNQTGETATIPIKALAGRRVLAHTRAPDGYELQSRSSSSPGVIGDLFGMRRYGNAVAIANRGRVVPVLVPGRYRYEVPDLVGWIVE